MTRPRTTSLRFGPPREADQSDARYAWTTAGKHGQSLFVFSRTRNVTLASLDLAVWRLRGVA